MTEKDFEYIYAYLEKIGFRHADDCYHADMHKLISALEEGFK